MRNTDPTISSLQNNNTLPSVNNVSCFNPKYASYDIYKRKQALYDELDYLDGQFCCSTTSCNDLALQYQNLHEKCNRLYASIDGDLDSKGNAIVCNRYNTRKQNVLEYGKRYKDLEFENNPNYKLYESAPLLSQRKSNKTKSIKNKKNKLNKSAGGKKKTHKKRVKKSVKTVHKKRKSKHT
jgi:hypothetical protein